MTVPAAAGRVLGLADLADMHVHNGGVAEEEDVVTSVVVWKPGLVWWW